MSVRPLPSPSATESVLSLTASGIPDVVAAEQPLEGLVLGRLPLTEVRRRLLHMTPGLLPALLWVIPHQDPWGPILADVVIVLVVAIVSMALLQFTAFARPGERDGRSSVLGYAFPVLAMLALCRGAEELGVMTLAILAFGDGSATLGGMLLGGQPLPWNRKKTWTGLACFLLVGLPLATLAYWGEARPVVPWQTAALCAGAATLTAAILETLPVRLNDNLRVGLSAAAMGALTHWILLG